MAEHKLKPPLRRHLIFHQFDPREHIAGGIAGYIRDLIRYAPEGHEFWIVGVEAVDTVPVGRWSTVSVAGKHIRFMPVAFLDASNQQRRIPHAARFLAGVIRYRPRASDALVHSHRAEAGALLTCLFPRERHVLFIHGDGREALRHKTETFWRWFPWLYNAVEAVAARRAAQTIVMSGAATERLRAHSKYAIRGANWFDAAHFRPNGAVDPSAELRIGWVGRLEPPKDPLLAVAVFEALAKNQVPFSAWIAGSGTLAPRVQRAVAIAGLGDSVELLGLLAPPELAERLRESTAYLMTSLWEGFPRSAVEALASGLPVVSTDVGELSTFVVNGVNGYLAGTRDAQNLAELLVDSGVLDRGRPVAETVDHLEASLVIGKLLEELASPRED
jgi:glycosyltransferase involved in cell wall biosynthesis